MEVSDKNEKKNLHKSLRFLLIIAQIFGFFPIQGVLSSEVTTLSFTWFSLRVVSSLLTISGGYFVSIGHINHMSIEGYDQFEMNGVMFYTCGATSCALFVTIAREWPKMMKKWHEIDDTMASYGWPRNLDRRLKIISIIFLTLEATEHISIQTNKVLVAVECRGSLWKGLEHFFVNMSFPHVFNFVTYSPWKGFVLQIINTRMAFSWTFLDLFIILMSCALASRFRQINTKIRYMTEVKVQSEKSWEMVREDYNRLCKMCHFLNKRISSLVLISFANNLYFIIVQVYGTIDLEETVLEKVYFFISLGLLILRLVLVCLYGSWIHDESKLPMYILASTSHIIYNKEIERFIERVKYDSIGLTGKDFFRITKHAILKMASAVVTYELVLIQFNKNNPKEKLPSKNSFC